MTIPKEQLAGLTKRQKRFVRAIEANTEGLTAVSTGVCPGCQECRDGVAPDMTMEDFEQAYERGEFCAEPFFSWQSCDLCGSALGGDREVWHAVDSNGEIVHGEHACVDCVLYLANGDLPGDE